MVNPAHRCQLEDDLIRFFRETHNASSAFKKPKDEITRYVSLPARTPDGEVPDAETHIDVTTLAEAILDGRIRTS